MKSRGHMVTRKNPSGKVQRKNRSRGGSGYSPTGRCAIERKRPGRGFRHVVTQDEVYQFLQIIPNWTEYAVGLERVLLDEGSDYRSGWFARGTIALCAFPTDLIVKFESEFFYRDIDFFKKFQVHWDTSDEEKFEVALTRSQAKYFALMRTLLHELGHHWDLATNRRSWCTRGESYAEDFGRRMESEIFNDYVSVFGVPA